MDPIRFQKAFDIVLVGLLHGPTEVLVAMWNERAAGTLNQIVPQWLLLPQGSWNSPWFMENSRKIIWMPRALPEGDKE